MATVPEHEVCNVTVYQHDDLTGWSVAVPAGGIPNEDAFHAQGAMGDAIASVRISGRGCAASIYSQTYFTGPSATLWEGSYMSSHALPVGSIRVFKEAVQRTTCGEYKLVKLSLDVKDGVVKVQERSQRLESMWGDWNYGSDYEVCHGKELTPPPSEPYTRVSDGESILAPEAHCSTGNRIGDDPSKPCLMRLEERTLEEAEEACAARGGRLANFGSVEDVQALQTFANGEQLYIGLRNSGSGWSFHGSAVAPNASFLEQLFGSSSYQSKACARLHHQAGDSVLQALSQEHCQWRSNWICEGASDNHLTPGFVVKGDLKADEGAFCLWHLPEDELTDYLPNDEGGFSNTDLACRLQTGTARERQCAFDPSSRRRGLVSRRGHYSHKQNYPVMGSEVGWAGQKGNNSFLTVENAYDAFHCHFTPENSGLLRMYAFQHMYERNYPGALRRTCGCGYKHLKNLVSRCDCTRNGVRSNNCARWHQDTLRRATEPTPVSCNNCGTATNL
jgi:hypothetical protein